MNYAIIAAGNGSRLAQEGVAQPKPLVRVQGECLIERLFRIFSQNDAENIFVICNEEMKDVAEFIRMYATQCRARISEPEIHLLVKSTPSSMHSLYELSQLMRKEMTSDKFILTTVDTIFDEKEFSEYVSLFAADDSADSMMGLTTYIDDEKPLYVEVSSCKAEDPSCGAKISEPNSTSKSTSELRSKITGYFDTQSGCTHISAGIYGLSTKAFAVLDNCIESGQSRMRNFQRALVTEGLILRPYVFSNVFDIDHASDIEKAENYLKK